MYELELQLAIHCLSNNRPAPQNGSQAKHSTFPLLPLCYKGSPVENAFGSQSIYIQGMLLSPIHLARWLKAERCAHLYFRGSCFRISSTVEMAYNPVSSVSSSTSEALPEPETAANACMQDSWWSLDLARTW